MSKPAYESFELLIGPRRRSGYPITIIDSPAGESRALSRFDSDDHELQEMLTDIVDGYSDTKLLKEFGSYLFSCLFTGKVERLYRDSLARVQAQDKRLRVRLRLEAPELAALPWEYLYDEETDKFLAISAHSALIRYIPMEVSKRPSAVKPPLRILVAISDPIDYDKLDVEQEKERIEQALAELVKQGLVELQLLERAELATLRQAIHRFSPHVFHYIGHSVFDEEKAYVILTDEKEYGQAVDEQTFSQLFDGADELRLAVLNGCQSASSSSTQLLSGLAANLLKHQLSAVVAMQYPIADEAALLFSAEFYGSLAAGNPIEAAITQARKALFMDLGGEGQDWGIPVLFLRANEGLLLHQAKQEKSILESPAPPEPCHPPKIKGFVGRQSELAHYSNELIHKRVAVISGMVGVGKSALAAALARQSGINPLFWHSLHASDSVQSLIWKMAAFLAWHGQAELWQMMNLTLQRGGNLPPATTLLDYLFQMIRELGKDKSKPLFCFDDFHQLDDDPLREPLKERLRKAVGANELSIILTSHRTPDLVRQLNEEPLMGLSAQDTYLLFAQHEITLSDQLMTQLHLITQGYPQLLILALNLLRGKYDNKPQELIKRLLRERDIKSYLLKEVDESLAEEQREVMNGVASFLGYPGTQDAICEVLDGISVGRPLIYLTNRYLLSVAAGEYDDEYSQYTFLRLFFYNLIPRSKRQAMHQRAAEYYEEEEEDFFKAILHYEQARDYKRAAELATNHIRRLLNLGHERLLLGVLEGFKEHQLSPPLWAAVQIIKGESYARQGKFSDSKNCQQIGLSTLEGCTPSKTTEQLEARACAILALIAQSEAPREALTWLKRGLAAVPEQKNSIFPAKLHLIAGNIHRLLGDYPKALASTQYGLHLLPPMSQLRIDGLLGLGTLEFAQGHISQARHHWELALTLSQQLHEHFRMITVLNNLSLAHYYAGDWELAIAKMEQAMSQAEHLGSIQQRIQLAHTLGLYYSKSGDDEQAKQVLQSNIALARQYKVKEFESGGLSTLADLYLRRGEYEHAVPLLQEAEQLIEATGFKYQKPELYRNWALVRLAKGLFDVALETIRRSLTIARDLKAKLEQGMSLRTLADIQLAAAKPLDEVLPLYEQSLAYLSEDCYEMACTKARWGQVLLENDEPERGQILLEEARETFSKLGAKRDLVMIEQ